MVYNIILTKLVDSSYDQLLILFADESIFLVSTRLIQADCVESLQDNYTI